VPYVGRPVGQGAYELAGEYYIHCFMYGEALKDKKEEIVVNLV
jgi:hypothetical protein